MCCGAMCFLNVLYFYCCVVNVDSLWENDQRSFFTKIPILMFLFSFSVRQKIDFDGLTNPESILNLVHDWTNVRTNDGHTSRSNALSIRPCQYNEYYWCAQMNQ